MVAEGAQSLAFAPMLHAMADRIIEGMTAGGAHPYNGLHLRVEKDARDWIEIMGGTQALWDSYVAAMKSVGFNATTRIYVASGMLTYGASCEMSTPSVTTHSSAPSLTPRTMSVCDEDEMDFDKYYLLKTGVCSDVHFKEQFIGQEELQC